MDQVGGLRSLAAHSDAHANTTGKLEEVKELLADLRSDGLSDDGTSRLAVLARGSAAR